MGKIDIKISAENFATTADVSFEQLRAIGAEAADRSAGMITKVSEVEVGPGRILRYRVKRAGLLDVMNFALHYRAGAPGAPASIRLESVNYLTSRPTMLFIPVGPASAVAYPSFKTFSQIVRQKLAV